MAWQVAVIVLAVVLVVVAIAVLVVAVVLTPSPAGTNFWYEYSPDPALVPAPSPNGPKTVKGPDAAVAACNADPACIGMFADGDGTTFQLVTQTPIVGSQPFGATFFTKQPRNGLMFTYTPLNETLYTTNAPASWVPTDPPGTVTCAGTTLDPSGQYCILPGPQATLACNQDPLCTGVWVPPPDKYPVGAGQLSRARPVLTTDPDGGVFKAKGLPNSVCVPGYSDQNLVRVVYNQTMSTVQLKVTLVPGSGAPTVYHVDNFGQFGGDYNFPLYPQSDTRVETDPSATLTTPGAATPFWLVVPTAAPGATSPIGTLLPTNVQSSLTFQALSASGAVLGAWTMSLQCTRPPTQVLVPTSPTQYTLTVTSLTPNLYAMLGGGPAPGPA